MILKENKKFRKMFIVTEYAALIFQKHIFIINVRVYYSCHHIRSRVDYTFTICSLIDDQD